MKNIRETVPLPVRVDAAKHLQDTLVDLADLAAQAKQAHWALTGPGFAELHAEMDSLAGGYLETVDEIGERMLALGIPPKGQVGFVAAHTSLPAFPDGFVVDTQVITLIADRIAEVARRVRQRLATIEGDAVSEDLLVGLAATLEKQLWMFQAREG
jgi:starvation-inducible DNA-binding protein